MISKKIRQQRKIRKQLAIIASKPNYCPPLSKKLECHACKYFSRCVFTKNNQYTPAVYHENHRLTEYVKE